MEKETGMSYCLGPLATWYPGVCWNNILSTGSKSEKFMEVSKSADLGNVCTKDWKTKHTAPFSLWVDATGFNPTAEPSSSRLWLCCGKRAGKALYNMFGKVLSSDTVKVVPRTVMNTRERLRMWDTSYRCHSPLLSSISSHRIWATVIRWDEYLSSLPRKNVLGKLTDVFLLHSALLLSKTVKNNSLTASCHLPAHVNSSPDVCHVFGYAGELHVGWGLLILDWFWGGLWQSKPLTGQMSMQAVPFSYF